MSDVSFRPTTPSKEISHAQAESSSVVSLDPPELLEPTSKQGNISSCSPLVNTALFGESFARMTASAKVSESVVQNAGKSKGFGLKKEERIAVGLVMAQAAPLYGLSQILGVLDSEI
jgi:hypothetical protein